MDVGPKKNIVGELTEAVRSTGLRMGLYYSLTEWNNPLHRWYTDPHDSISRYVEEHMIPQFKEVIGTYKPSLIFSDGEWFNKADDFKAAELISWYYNLVGDNAIVNNRWGGGSDIGFLTPEYSSGIEVTDRPWVEVRGLGRSFGLNRNEKLDAYMTSSELVHLLVKSVSRGGGIIINVGPDADGQIPLLQQERLIELGQWLEVNGEAIYGAEPWMRHTEKKDVYLNRVDPEISFNWVRNSPGKPITEDAFSGKWTGYIKAPDKGNYLFSAEVDDRMRLWINNKLIIDKWDDTKKSADGNVMSNDDYSNENGRLYMEAGIKYPIKIDYYEDNLNARIHLFWSSEKIDTQIVPQRNLFSSEDVASGDGLKAEYSSKSIWLCYTQKDTTTYVTMLDWPGRELVFEYPEPKENLKVFLLGKEGQLDYIYKNGKMHINLSNIYHNDLPYKHAWTIKLQ